MRRRLTGGVTRRHTPVLFEDSSQLSHAFCCGITANMFILLEGNHLFLCLIEIGKICSLSILLQ